jgi:hypothetical protein
MLSLIRQITSFVSSVSRRHLSTSDPAPNPLHSMRRPFANGLLGLGALGLIAGCGIGGYPGGGIEALSKGTLTLDAGQSYSISAALQGATTVTWSLTGSCGSTGCGTTSATEGAAVVYTAPTGVTAPFQTVLKAYVAGTQNSKSVTITVNPDTTLQAATVNVTVGQAVSVPITYKGGTAPVTVSLTSSLPAGLAFNASTGIVSGTPAATGTIVINAKAVDSSDVPLTVTATGDINVTPGSGPVANLTLSNPPPVTAGIPYTGTIGVSGGSAPYNCQIVSGSLPAGMTESGCTISGTTTAPGSYPLMVTATDSSNPTLNGSGTVMLTVNGGSLTITNSMLPNGTVGVPYSATIGVTGGTAPYSCTFTSGTLPAGLSLSGCTVSGTPTTPITANLTVKATDSSNPALTGSGPESITIAPAPLSITNSMLPNGTVGVPYSATIGVTGGTAPYSCTFTSGTLPAGLSLSGCTVSGTPTTPITANLTVKATDSSSPALTASGPESITIAPAPLSITNSMLPNGTVGVPYSATIGVSGGTAPYSCTFTSGTLPAGLSLSGCTVSGTPTTPITANLTVKATDSSSPQLTASGPESITIAPAPLSITTSMLPNGTVGVPYSATIGVTGGTAPYSCTFTSGTLPAGLSLNGCTVSGTPTTPITANLTVKATDSSSPQETASGPESITIAPAPLAITTAMLPNGTVGVPYSATIGVSGGTAPYSCTFTSGTLPAGLSLNGCVVSGTPTTPITANLTVQATDSSSPQETASGPESITINPAPVVLTLTPPANATVGVPYTGTIGVSGGTAPYSCSLAGGTLPTGLTLNSNCTITGTTTVAGPVSISVTATDSKGATTTGPVAFNVNGTSPLTLTVSGGLPNATVNVPYTYTLMAQGGTKPYTYSQTAGALPPGITLSPSGVISGTPTAVGAYSFTATVTDTSNPMQTASVPLILNVLFAPGPNNPELQGPYAYLFQGYDDHLVGVLAYQTATAGSFTADGMGGISAGELDANHQTSAPTTTTVPTQQFLGSYTIGADNRGQISITTLNADGTVNKTSVYAIAVKAPTAPATTSVEGSLIEFDNNQLAGTKGSGTFLAQTPASFTSGLTGTYAFGISGDTPCLPACSVGIVAGPVAAVGEFSTNGAGAITDGETDANIATTQLASEILSGTYATADANGRVQLSLSTSNAPAGVYPTDYAVYMVNATQGFVISTDKHSAYILLAGSLQQQTQSTFSSASMNGPFVGYENSIPNPSVLTTTLSNVANFSTATLFRGVGGSNGNCNITNVNTGGTQALLNQLTGLGGSLTGLQGLLGTYASTGSTTCPVISNGRGVLAYPPTLNLLGIQLLPAPDPRVFYLSSPNAGYFLETGYAAVGRFEAQTGAPYSLATFDGTYIYGQSPASSAASIDTSGVVTADGKGNETSTEDLNVGVGTLNVLQLGTTGTGTYTTPDPTTGVFTLNTTTYLYTINPGRFALLDTNILTTSPSVAILY